MCVEKRSIRHRLSTATNKATGTEARVRVTV